MPLALLIAALLVAPLCQSEEAPDDLWIQVLDARSDTPIEHARVFLSFAPRALLRQYEPFSGNDRRIGRTDASGVTKLVRDFTLEEDDSILVTAEGYESSLQPLGPGAAFARRCGVVCLEPLRTLVGQVHDPEGAAEKGELEVVVKAWIANPNRAALVPLPTWASLYRPTELRDSVRPDGSFGPLLVPRADLMTVQVEQRRTGYRSEHVVVPSSGSLPPVDVHLPELAIVSVRVPDDGGDAAIEADYHGFGGISIEPGVRAWRHLAQQRVGADRFEVLARVRPGRVRIGLLLAARDTWFYRPLDVTPGEVVDLILEPPEFCPITGRVVDLEGLPVQGAWISWWSRGPRGQLQRDPPTVPTAEDGSFRLEEVLAESSAGELRAVLDGAVPARVASLVGVAPGSAQDVVLAKRSTGALTLRIDTEGSESVAYLVMRRGGSALPSEMSSLFQRSGRGPDEHWLLERQDLAAGPYLVLGLEQSGQCRTAEATVMIEPGVETEVVLKLEPPGTLELRPPTGALDATPVILRRGDDQIVLFGQIPILPTPIALAPGPISVEWERPLGVWHSTNVQISSGTVIMVSLDG